MPDVITDWLARYHIGAETSGLLVRLTAAVIVLLVCLVALKITRGIFNSLLQRLAGRVLIPLAARFGGTRLIDNVEFTMPKETS